MEKIEIGELRNIQLNILQYFDECCAKQDLRYFLSNGTALGAVKYEGFIPWDDDIDVCMPREDYMKLIKNYHEKAFDKKYRLIAFELDRNYLFPFAKMFDTTTVLEEKNISNGVELGVNIDIFPLDGFGETRKEAQAIFRHMEMLRKCLYWAKLKSPIPGNPFKGMVKWVISMRYKLVGAERYCEKISQYAQKFEYSSNYIGNSTWGFYGENEAHDRKVFESIVLARFEGKEYPIPVGYDEYLRGLYGNYKMDPPLEEQITHHNFSAYYKEGV